MGQPVGVRVPPSASLISGSKNPVSFVLLVQNLRDFFQLLVSPRQALATPIITVADKYVLPTSATGTTLTLLVTRCRTS